MTSAIYQGTLWGAWITPVEAISGQPQKERLAYKLVDNKSKEIFSELCRALQI